MLNRAKKAFTLLELIVVLLVLGVLAAIAVPTYTTVKTNSVKRSINSTLEALDRAGEAAYASNTNLSDEAILDDLIIGVPSEGDRTVSDEVGTIVSVQLVSGTIDCIGYLELTDGVGAITPAVCS